VAQRDSRGRFPKGQSGNPGGRKKSPLREALDEVLREQDDESGEPNYLLVARKLVERAKNGNETAIKEVFDRIEGKAIQTVNANIAEPPRFVRFDTDDEDEPEDKEAQPE
jgi:hypothetical protein